MKLKRNMGPADQVFRGSMGIGLIYLGPVSKLLTADFMSGMLLALVGARRLPRHRHAGSEGLPPRRATGARPRVRRCLAHGA